MTDEFMMQQGIELATILGRNTVTSIMTKLKSVRSEKELEKIKANYEEIINELINERNELQSLAISYKEIVNKINISDSDIEHLQNTISTIINILNMEENNQIMQFKNLISVDTLKALQLLGFNYKEAIGEPLTDVVASNIRKYNIDNQNIRS